MSFFDSTEIRGVCHQDVDVTLADGVRGRDGGTHEELNRELN